MRCPLMFTIAMISVLPVLGAINQPVKVEGGSISGVPGKTVGIMVYKGIPFAAPPVGDLRWQAPRPVIAWDGVREAKEFGASCIQSVTPERKPWTYEFMTHNNLSEDCLFLNVWTPAKSANAKLPVFVWIHGGGNTEGSSAVPVYDGEGLASKGVIFVSINYRLGVLGFFSHPELSAEASYHASGNYGLLDQIAAVRWVRNNIAGFGGDPNRVTVAGQSAGAGAVHNLTASPLAKGLFQRAIEESGSSAGPGPMQARTLADQEKDGVKFAEAKGATSLAQLRQMPWKEIVAPIPGAEPATAPGGFTPPRFRFGIVVDGYALTATVAETYAEGKQNDVPELTGCNKGEGGATPISDMTAETFDKQAGRYGDLSKEFLALYPAATDEQARIAQNESSWDHERVAMYVWAENRSKTAKTNAYTYFWDHSLPGPDAGKFGAFHTSEVPYVLNTLTASNRPFTEEDRKIADTLSDYWVNFAKNGNPNGKGLPHWPSVKEKPGYTMELGDKMQPIPVAGSEAKEKFFDAYIAKPRSGQQFTP